jgi:cellulose biosynthesis protein BcsQ
MAILTFWSDKGGTGKTMLTAQAASWAWPEDRPVVVLDLDPQGDAFGWANRAGVPSRVPGSPEEAADLIRLLGPDHTVLVDCPPGRLRDQRMAGVGVVLADALLLPSGSGRPELDALGRAIRALDEMAGRGAALKAGIILNHFRETTRNRVVEEGLRLAKLPLLGRLSERAAFPEAFADGRSLVHLGGAAAHEAKTLWSRIESWLQSA